MANRDSWDSYRNKLAKLQEDKQYEPYLPLLNLLRPRLNAKADDRNLELAKAVFAVVETLHVEKKQGSDAQTYVEKMSGGFVQRIVAEHVQQANRDFISNIIINVFQQSYGKQGDIEAPKRSRTRVFSDTQAEQRYRERIVREHQHVDIFGRAKPLELEKIYITLRVGEYVPAEERPDEPSRDMRENPEQRSGFVEATEVLYFSPPRLAVLGDPGSGKTTLLRYLAQWVAKKDCALGDWARKIMPPGKAKTADRIHRKLHGVDPWSAGTLAGLLALILWGIGTFQSTSWVLIMLVGLVLAASMLGVLSRQSALSVRIWTAVGVLVFASSVYFELLPWWAIGSMGIALLMLHYPYWIALPLSWLKRIRDRLTRYPLPFYLTLNDLARAGDTLEDHLAQELHKGSFSCPRDVLKQKLDNGECLVLLDALDEVIEDDAYRRIAKDIVEFSETYHRVPVIVTCRTAGFRDQRTVLRGFYRLEVQEFTAEEVERFIHTWFGNPTEPYQSRADGLLQALGRSARMRQLAGNPLLLTMICLLYERDLHLPERRVELYEQCVDELLEKIDTERGLDAHAQFSAAKKRKALQDVARHFHDQGLRLFGQGPLMDVIEAVLPKLGYDVTRKKEFLQELMERSGLIRQQSKTTYSFAHLTFQEFFTAEQIYVQGKDKSLFAHQGDPWWHEVIQLYVGLQPDATVLLHKLKEHDILLAADALADARDSGIQAFQEVAVEIISELKKLVEGDPDRRQEAADRLAATGKWGAGDYLVDYVHAEEQSAISLAAVLALDRAGDRTVLAALCEPLGPVLRLLTRHLGKVGSQLDGRILSLLDRLGLPLVYVPAGEFQMGDDRTSLRLEEYWIGKFPVINVLYQRFMNETKHQANGGWPKAFQPGKENHPAVFINFYDALEFCKWAGTMLPNEAEWEKAARGTDGRRYPWGQQWDAARCNVSGRGTTSVDAYPNGVSPYGCFDMSGNVREWTRSHYKSSPYDPADGRKTLDESDSVNRVICGGSWQGDRRGAPCSDHLNSSPLNGDNAIGFRVVVSPISGL